MYGLARADLHAWTLNFIFFKFSAPIFFEKENKSNTSFDIYLIFALHNGRKNRIEVFFTYKMIFQSILDGKKIPTTRGQKIKKIKFEIKSNFAFKFGNYRNLIVKIWKVWEQQEILCLNFVKATYFSLYFSF